LSVGVTDEKYTERLRRTAPASKARVSRWTTAPWRSSSSAVQVVTVRSSVVVSGPVNDW
jgi:hypothetical protein